MIMQSAVPYGHPLFGVADVNFALIVLIVVLHNIDSFEFQDFEIRRSRKIRHKQKKTTEGILIPMGCSARSVVLRSGG